MREENKYLKKKTFSNFIFSKWEEKHLTSPNNQTFLFCFIERHAKIQNRRQTPSRRKVSA